MTICEDCNFCKPLFQRLGYELSAYRYYYCETKEDFTELENTCERWKEKPNKYHLTSARFEQAEEDIKAIITILKE